MISEIQAHEVTSFVCRVSVTAGQRLKGIYLYLIVASNVMLMITSSVMGKGILIDSTAYNERTIQTKETSFSFEIHSYFLKNPT
jgi:hypothetical protein